MKRPHVIAAAATALALLLASCSNSDPLDQASSGASASSASAPVTSTESAPSSDADQSGAASSDGTSPGQPAPSSGPSAAGSVVIGSADFTESVIIAAIYAGALRAKGVDVQTKERLGSREIYLKALQDGSITVIPEYTGTLLQFFDKSATQTDPEEVYLAAQKVLPSGLTLLEKSPAEDKDSLTVTKETADRLGLKTIADLEGKSKDLVLGGPKEWQTRMTGVPGFEKIYGLTFKKFEVTDAGGPITIKALQTGIIDAGNVFSTDPAIAKNNLVSLEDTKGMFGAQNVVPLVAESVASDTVKTALNAVSAKLTTEDLLALNDKVSNQHLAVDEVAAAWLKEKGLG